MSETQRLLDLLGKTQDPNIKYAKKEIPLISESMNQNKVYGLNATNDQLAGPKLPSIPLESLGNAGPNNVNWLNSSYSGTDIKVVANLYQPTDTQHTKEQHEIKIANLIAQGAISCSYRLQNANIRLDTNKRLYNYFEEACFPGGEFKEPEGSQATRILWSNLANYVGPVGVSHNQVTTGVFIRACENIAASNEALATELEARLKLMVDQKAISSSVVVLHQLQTLSLQSHREKTAVRALGKSFANSYVRGPRTLAGSMIFTVFDEHPLYKLIRAMEGAKLYGETAYNDVASISTADQLPPIDLTVIFANEYGSISRMGIYGVEFLNDGLTFSVEDMLTEQIMNFTARDIDIMTSVGVMKLSQATRQIYNKQGEVVSATELLFNSQNKYNEYCTNLGIRRAYRNR